MIWDWMRYIFLLFVLSGLVACAGLGTPAEPTPVPFPSSTSSAIPTNTPEPTITPLPTDTPSPTSTPTITATPTPQIGETRINSETGQEEIYGDSGEWVKVVKAAEASDLEGVTEATTELVTNEDGSRTLSWTADDSDYEYIFDSIDNHLVNSDGEAVEASFDITFSAGNGKPFVRMVPDEGKHLASWLYTEDGGQWQPRFSVALNSEGQPMINLDQKEIEPYMPQNLGYLDESTWTQPGDFLREYGIEGDFVDFRGISIVGKPLTVVEEKLIWKGQVSKTIWWLKIRIDEAGNNKVTIPIFIDEYRDDKDIMSKIIVHDSTTQPSLVSAPRGPDGNFAPYRKLPEILELIEDTTTVNLFTILPSDNMIDTYNDSNNYLGKPLPPFDGDRGTISGYLDGALQRDQANHALQVEWMDQMLDPEHTTTVPDVKFGITTLVLLQAGE